jgi:thiamine-monophosphate kinase
MATTEEERIERLAQIFGAARERSPDVARERSPDVARERLPDVAHPGVLVGIGDDAAVLAAVGEPLVWTVDAAVDGTHFRRAWLSFEDIGYRSTMAAASDLAAMAADPIALLSALVLPDDVTDADLEALARGQRDAAAEIGAAVIGGNLARGRELSITTTALGRAARPILRSGARPGDTLWLSGPVGLAAAGLRLLAEGRPIDDEAAVACVHAWRRPRARIAAGRAMRPAATAAADVSDGLARDTTHIARASSVRAVLDLRSLETAALTAVAERLGVPALDLALFGGEDYALVIAAPAGTPVPDAAPIGRLEPLEGRHESSNGPLPERAEREIWEGRARGSAAGGGHRSALPGAAPGDPTAPGFLVGELPDGSRVPLRSGGHDHFAR